MPASPASSGAVALDHVTIISDDFDASRPIYDAVLGALGMNHSVEFEDPEEDADDPGTVAAIGYAPDNQPARFWLVAGLRPTRGAHMAFGVDSPEAVEAAFAAARAAGARVVQAPRAWEARQLNYFGMQIADAADNVVEVLHLRP